MESLRDFLSSFADQQNFERLKQCADIEQALRECERIQQELVASSSSSSSSSSSQVSSILPVPAVSLHDSRAGMKISRFYGWGLRNPKAVEAVAAMRGDSSFYSMQKEGVMEQQQGHGQQKRNQATRTITTTRELEDSGNGNGRKEESSSMSCSKEHHALWGCRAMALGCAKELVQLKKCFEENHPLDHNDPPYFCYDGVNAQKQKQQQKENTTAAASRMRENQVCRESMQNLGHCVTEKWKDLNERLN